MALSPEDPLSEFVALLKSEGRNGVLGLDCGHGADGLRFVRSGIHFTGVDRSEENIHTARAHGLEASVAGAPSLPFADSAFLRVGGGRPGRPAAGGLGRRRPRTRTGGGARRPDRRRAPGAGSCGTGTGLHGPALPA
ncbi:class I SAM-dependent methyltransferase [Arthrobacter sp. OVS8]|nr:class I SAM-dependent methyltransferase [Arthrobacter sp. OVS8]